MKRKSIQFASPKCQFCEGLKNGFFEFEKNIPLDPELQFKNRVIFETENFVVFPSIGQFVEGYLLIASKKHYRAIGSLPPKLYGELDSIITKIRKLLSDFYEIPLFYENGSAPGVIKGVNTVDHLHLHAMPVSVDLLPLLTREFKCEPLSSYNDLHSLFERGISYYYLESNSGKKYYFEVIDKPQSQYIRQLIAKDLSIPDRWNWKEYYGVDELRRTTDRLRNTPTK